MKRWLVWFLIVFVVVNLGAIVANLPNPYGAIMSFVKTSGQPRTMDGLIGGLGLAMGIAMLIGWAIIGFVMSKTIK